MVTMFKPKPQLLRAVDKPENVSSQEIAKARPVYIDGLPEGGGDGGSSTTDAITIKDLAEFVPDGTPLNDFLLQLATNVSDMSSGYANIFLDLNQRLTALEEAQEG